MHPQAFQYIADAVKTYASTPGLKVVEFGSADVNGSARQLFDRPDYHGIDLRPGNGVDEVADATRWNGRGRYDVVVCTETLEHCEKPNLLIRQARKALKPGGMLIATMAAPERAPHDCNGGALTDDREHYRGITEGELRTWLRRWLIVSLQHSPADGDLYLIASRPEED